MGTAFTRSCILSLGYFLLIVSGMTAQDTAPRPISLPIPPDVRVNWEPKPYEPSIPHWVWIVILSLSLTGWRAGKAILGGKPTESGGGRRERRRIWTSQLQPPDTKEQPPDTKVVGGPDWVWLLGGSLLPCVAIVVAILVVWGFSSATPPGDRGVNSNTQQKRADPTEKQKPPNPPAPRQ
jgi:hypothetical protein